MLLKGVIWLFFLMPVLLTSCASLMRDKAQIERLEALIQAKIEIVKNHLDRGQSQAALGGVANLLDEHSEHPDVLVVAGITHLALGNASYARSLLHKAFSASPTPDVALNYSSALISRKQYRTARNILRKFLGSKQYKHRERLYHNMGWAYESQRKWKLAEKYYRKALNTQPTFYLSLYRMGVVQEALGKVHKAVTFYRKASQYCGICFDPVQDLTKVLQKVGRSKEALTVLDHYLGRKVITQQNRRQALSLKRRMSHVKMR